MTKDPILRTLYACIVLGGILLGFAIHQISTYHDRQAAFVAECNATPGSTPQLCLFMQRAVMP